ncbi:MAG: HD domain-containing protein [Rubrobacteraceae bacterium]
MEEVEGLVARVGTHPVWGYGHCLRVLALAEEIGDEEGVGYDGEMLRLAALLHDIGLYKAYNLREASDHAERSAVVAGRILRDGDFPAQATRVVVEAIRCHPPGASPASSMEAGLLKDAVALDYLGSIGVSRVMAMVGSEEEIPDLPSAIRQAEGLKRTIPGLLVFESSRDIASERAIEMEDFLSALRRSTDGLRLL